MVWSMGLSCIPNQAAGKRGEKRFAAIPAVHMEGVPRRQPREFICGYAGRNKFYIDMFGSVLGFLSVIDVKPDISWRWLEGI